MCKTYKEGQADVYEFVLSVIYEVGGVNGLVGYDVGWDSAVNEIERQVLLAKKEDLG